MRHCALGSWAAHKPGLALKSPAKPKELHTDLSVLVLSVLCRRRVWFTLGSCTGTTVRAWTVTQGAEGSLILPSLHWKEGSATQLKAIFKHLNQQAPLLKDSGMPRGVPAFLSFESQPDKLKAKESLIQINFISRHGVSTKLLSVLISN